MELPLRSYLYEAIELEKSGKKVELRKPSEYTIPEELQTLLNNNTALKDPSMRSHQDGGSHTSSTSQALSRQKLEQREQKDVYQ